MMNGHSLTENYSNEFKSNQNENESWELVNQNWNGKSFDTYLIRKTTRSNQIPQVSQTVNASAWGMHWMSEAETMPSLDLIQWVQVFLRGKEVGCGDMQVDSMSRWKAERSKNTLIPMSPSGQRVPLPSHLSLSDFVFLRLISIRAEE